MSNTTNGHNSSQKETNDLVIRIDERVKNLEKRIGRIEVGILSVLVASLIILARAVLNASGIPLI